MNSFQLTIKKSPERGEKRFIDIFRSCVCLGRGCAELHHGTVSWTVLVIMRLRGKLVQTDASPKTVP